MKITVVGIGYVGLANAVLLAQNNEVIALDINEHIVELINNKQSHIKDQEISDFLLNKQLNLNATTDKAVAYKDCDYIVVATPTDYDTETHYFNTSSIESVLDEIHGNVHCPVIIKSTIPMGYCDSLKLRYPKLHIIFSPEFLREGKALYDNLYPSRIIMGEDSAESRIFAQLLVEGALKQDIPILYMNANEAEAVKLFSNTYLALRVAYFNELDAYAETHHLDIQKILEGVGLDPRIGTHYNNPSFGYGGYCLPKDTKQLLANYKDIPNEIIKAIVNANDTRKQFIANQILSKNPTKIGIYRLTMKVDSDNFRASSIQGVIQHLVAANKEVVIYEPSLSSTLFENLEVINDLATFKKSCDIIVANRMNEELNDVIDKVYTRDIFSKDM